MKPVEKKKIKLYYHEIGLFYFILHIDLPCMCFFYSGHTHTSHTYIYIYPETNYKADSRYYLNKEYIVEKSQNQSSEIIISHI